ncbi:ELMO/CED-12 family-domain-containing protein [Hysterangium stoloniferum]|nr:ELMO/CED-12 family-domain-containing protein [Hysterangium stoloniferum]
MSSSVQSPTSLRSPVTPQQARRSVLIPTNSVTTKDGQVVRARIDQSLSVNDVVKQLCSNLKIQEPHVLYALRDDSDELVTNENLRKMIRQKANLRLVNAPKIEALEIADKLSLRDERTLRMTLFSLQKLIREEGFAKAFLSRDGMHELIEVISGSHGNTLAYALTAMQNLMELDYGWSNLGDDFISSVVQILASPQNLINVCRPATAILKKLVEADPRSAPGPIMAGSSTRPPVAPPGTVYRYGFDRVYEQMSQQRGLLDIVVGRLGSADSVMGLNSMMLINSLLSHATDARWEDLTSELERLNVRKAVIRLMSSHTIEDLTSSILDFQANIVRVTFRRKITVVDPEQDASQEETLRFIWSSAKISELSENGKIFKWRRLGFETEDIRKEFVEVGALGLDCLKNMVISDPDYFSKVVLEQISRPVERRCPVAKASNEVVELLAEHWAIFAPGYSTSTTFQPFFLNFAKVHTLATKFFLRMWNESGAAAGDFTRVVALVRSQVKVALRDENTRPWHEVETDFEDSEYRDVRDRQMKELEMEDDLLSKVPVRNLRAKLYKESFEFVRQQRIQCLMQGAWFVNANPLSTQIIREAPRRPNRPWRFMRLDKGAKYIHYVDSAIKFPVRAGLEDLPERIEIAQIAEIGIGTCALPPNVLNSDLPTAAPIASPLSFSLYSTRDGSLADQVATDPSRWADWTDGLNMLRRDGGHVATPETAEFVKALTEIGLKIKLLNLSGEKVEIPSSLVAGPPPPTVDFFFADPGYLWQ